MTTRDSEKGRTYKAEWAVEALLARGGNVTIHGTRLVVPVERRFGSLEHVQIFVDHVIGSVAVKEQFGEVRPIKVRHRKGSRKAHFSYGPREIAINDPEYGRPGWAMREAVVLHEISHALAPYDHTARFRGVNVWLHSEFIGPEAGWLLSCSYMDNGLAVTAV